MISKTCFAKETSDSEELTAEDEPLPEDESENEIFTDDTSGSDFDEPAEEEPETPEVSEADAVAQPEPIENDWGEVTEPDEPTGNAPGTDPDRDKPTDDAKAKKRHGGLWSSALMRVISNRKPDALFLVEQDEKNDSSEEDQK